MASNPLMPMASSEGTNTFAIAKSDITHLFQITPNTEQTIAVPANRTTVSIVTNLGVYFMSRGATTLTFPSANESPTTKELSPSIRKVTPGDTLRFISENSGWMEVSFYD